MPYETLISSAELRLHEGEANWVIVDARFSLAEPARGRAGYLAAHVPGAVYAHLDEDLSGRVVGGLTGRHPLPEVDALAATFGRWGIGPGVQVVAYDDAGGALAAARVWWLLRWLGHTACAVLDGGWQAWVQAGLPPVENRGEANSPRPFTPVLHPEMVLDAAEVDAIRLRADWRLLDVRAAERFRGENETIDPVAGHIPGAVSAPFAGNLTPRGFFRPVAELRDRYHTLVAGVPVAQVVAYCGSGVTAAHSALAMAHAGFGLPRLYAGSWSEWITDEKRAVSGKTVRQHASKPVER